MHPTPQFFFIYVHDKPTRQALMLFIQEIKRIIIYRRMNIIGIQGIPTPLVRIQVHFIAVTKKVHSFLTYQGVLTNKPSIYVSHGHTA